MKTRVAMLVGLLASASAAAAPPVDSPLLGHWRVDTSRLPMAPEARPRGVDLRFAADDAGRWHTRVEVIDAAGQRHHSESRTDLAGTPAAVSGGFEADLAATTLPAPGVLVMQLSRGGVPGSTRVYSLGSDGTTMTETAAYFGEAGRPIVRTHHFRRAP